MGITIWNYNELYKLSRNISTIFRQRGSKTKLQQKKVKFELSRNEKYTISILIAMVAFWLTEWLHGLEIATVTIIGVFLLTLPKLGVMQWKESLKGVSWNLILFVGAAIALGKSLMESGAAQWIMQNLF